MSRDICRKLDHVIKILVIGDTTTGKSSLLNNYIEGSFSDDFRSTIGVDFKVKTFEYDNKFIKLQIWDTAGQERFRSITSSYYRDVQGIILFFDVTNEETFKNIDKWLEYINLYGSIGVDIILVGNKIDLKNRVISYETVKTYADKLGYEYIETSAKNNINIDTPFINITKNIINSDIVYNKQNENIIKLDDNSKYSFIKKYVFCNYL